MKALPEANERLHPPRCSPRFHILTLLRNTLTFIAATCLPKGQEEIVLVDFGCGTMPYRPIFARHVTSYIGVDVPENPNADLHVEPDGRTPLPCATADIVLSTQALEHVTEPARYLYECFRILKPGGLLILSTHGYWVYHPHPQDLWRWTNEGLHKIVSDAGFRIEGWHGLMGLAATALHLLQDALTPVVPRFARRIFWFGMQTLIMAVDMLYSGASRASEACVFVLLARKPGP